MGCPLYSNDMPVCNDCLKLKNLYTCANEITIGQVSPAIEVYIYFENVATGKITQVSAESDINGIVVYTLDFEPLASSDYKVWLAEQDPLTADSPLPVIIDDVEAECFILRFERIYGSENVTVTGLDQQFELA